MRASQLAQYVRAPPGDAATSLTRGPAEVPRRRLAVTLERLAQQFGERFPPRLAGPRRIGREAEFPLVWPDGRAGDVSLLWEPLLAEGKARVTHDDPNGRGMIERVDLGPVGYEVEMGRATVEVVLPPAVDLHELETVSAEAIGRLVRAATARGMLVLGYGIQPRTPRSSRLMTPKRRYRALYRAVGRSWLHFTTTASDQVQVDICRDELMDAVNVLNVLSGPIIALTANSSVYAGRPGRFVSGREGLLASLGDERYGMTPQRFAALDEFMAFICGQTCYVLKQDGRHVRYGRPFTSYLAAHGPDLDAYMVHEHYTWNSARPRAQHGTIEVRPACQQPPDEPLAASALSLALVEGLADTWAFVRDRLGSDPWPAMAAYRKAAIRSGLRAPEPVPGFLSGLVDVCERALRRRGRGEERYLFPIRTRIAKRMLPADRAATLFQAGGIAALISSLRLDATTP
ncbi:MAG: glutamate-cysteine ligase family protein [Armatimonadota bacterium]